ncbi:hypothetical protein F4604DRAFT_1722839, partial [Suillus subluteus]
MSRWNTAHYIGRASCLVGLIIILRICLKRAVSSRYPRMIIQASLGSFEYPHGIRVWKPGAPHSGTHRDKSYNRQTVARSVLRHNNIMGVYEASLPRCYKPSLHSH